MDDTLESLYQQISAFDFTYCGMAHERIQRVKEGLEPIRNASIDHGYQRSEYCCSTTRAQRLGCAHTTGRIRFCEFLDALPRPMFDEERITKWKEELQKLDLLIVKVDWQKSDAELDHARQSDALCQGTQESPERNAQLANTSQLIRELIDTHTDYIERLRQLRNEVLAEIRFAQAHRV
ncbi:MAG: hypothetical protein AAF065_04990 [Verrucomicrobiota bacterium]